MGRWFSEKKIADMSVRGVNLDLEISHASLEWNSIEIEADLGRPLISAIFSPKTSGPLIWIEFGDYSQKAGTKVIWSAEYEGRQDPMTGVPKLDREN